MTGPSTADGAATAGEPEVSHLPTYLLDHNPDCPKCPEIAQRAQKRLQDKMEAIRQNERTENALRRETAAHNDFKLLTSHRMQYLDQHIKELTERTAYSVEDHNNTVNEKVTECAATYQQALNQLAEANSELSKNLVNKQTELDAAKACGWSLEHELAQTKEEAAKVPSLTQKVAQMETAITSTRAELERAIEGKKEAEEQKSQLQKTVNERNEQIRWHQDSVQESKMELENEKKKVADLLRKLNKAKLEVQAIKDQPQTPTPQRSAPKPSSNRRMGISPIPHTPLQINSFDLTPDIIRSVEAKHHLASQNTMSSPAIPSPLSRLSLPPANSSPGNSSQFGRLSMVSPPPLPPLFSQQIGQEATPLPAELGQQVFSAPISPPFDMNSIDVEMGGIRPADPFVDSSTSLAPQGVDVGDIPDGEFEGLVCQNCHWKWWNSWCDHGKDGCINCKELGVTCKRPACYNPDTCQDEYCNWAHAHDGYQNTYRRPAKMKRKGKKDDKHEVPPSMRRLGLAQ